MTLKQMTQILIEKGYSHSFAEAQALLDFPKLNATETCSVCRGMFNSVQWMYHYHPCE